MKRKILFSLISIIIILVITQVSYAAVEIVPSKDGTGTDAIVNTTISNSYLMCQDMKNTGGSLKGTTVVPHLATNKDWGAVSYLSNSIYGTNTTGENTGKEVTIDGVKYYSTTTNITGVMNWGVNPNLNMFTYTSGIIPNYNHSTSTVVEYVEEIYANKDTRFVDILDEDTLGMGVNETLGFYNTQFDFTKKSNYSPCSARNGLFNGIWGNGWWQRQDSGWEGGIDGNGSQHANHTFRPVIWNK